MPLGLIALVLWLLSLPWPCTFSALPLSCLNSTLCLYIESFRSLFLVLASPAEERSYNYADDEAFYQLIKERARGAYWDIISQSKQRHAILFPAQEAAWPKIGNVEE
jgi:hypothetical protein